MAAYGCHHSIVCAARDRGNGMGVRERGGGRVSPAELYR